MTTKEYRRNYMQEKRANETEKEREKRLKYQREYDFKKREKESLEEKEIRLARMRENNKAKYKMKKELLKNSLSQENIIVQSNEPLINTSSLSSPLKTKNQNNQEQKTNNKIKHKKQKKEEFSSN